MHYCCSATHPPPPPPTCPLCAPVLAPTCSLTGHLHTPPPHVHPYKPPRVPPCIPPHAPMRAPSELPRMSPTKYSSTCPLGALFLVLMYSLTCSLLPPNVHPYTPPHVPPCTTLLHALLVIPVQAPLYPKLSDTSSNRAPGVTQNCGILQLRKNGNPVAISYVTSKLNLTYSDSNHHFLCKRLPAKLVITKTWLD